MTQKTDMQAGRRVALSRVAGWQWELNGAGDPSRVWIDHRDSGQERTKPIDAGFTTGTWVMRLTLPSDLSEVSDASHPMLITLGLADAAKRLDEKLTEAVGLCRERGLSWAQIAPALGVSKQAAWRRFGSS
jgi:DNA-directed RNA polymerase specialized sigma24 family protein